MNTLSRKKTEVFSEITEHLLSDDKPSEYIKTLSEEPEFGQYPLTFLKELKSTGQSVKYHPEGSVWNHTMMVVDEAAKVRLQSNDPKAFMWAALLHDIGKPATTRERKGKITSYDHDKEGEKVTKEFLEFYEQEESFIQTVSALVRYHMHMLYVLKKLPYSDVKGLSCRVDANDIALLCRSDRLGRSGADVEAEDAEYKIFAAELERINRTKQ